MSKTDKIAEILDLPIKKYDENLPSTEIREMPDGVKESLKQNKKELNEIYRSSKKLLLNLINEADDIGRARDIEVLTGFMKETTEVLRKIRDIDKDIIDVDTNGGDDPDKAKIINNMIFQGDTRDIIELVKELKEKKKETVINTEAKEVKEETNEI